jgi:adenine-specific DNA-methyltransferase
MTKTPITTETVNPMDAKLSALRDLFPEAFREDKLDTDLLASTLWDRISTEKEGYGMTWAGKADARRQILTPTSHTLAGDEKGSVQWDKTKNIFIEWDNLTVLKLLQKGYTKQVKMVYIDPPYNTGKDFIYNDNFHADKTDYEETTGQRTAEGVKMVANTETNGRYHSDWLSMMYPRLHLARNLLRDDGVIFVSIDDHEVHNLRKIMDEVFWEENFIWSVVWNSTKSVTNTALISVSHTYNLIFAKNKSYYVENREKFRLMEDGEGFANPDNDSRWPWKADPFQVGGWRPNQQYEIINPKTWQSYTPNPDSSWKNDFDKFQELVKDNRIVFGVDGEAWPQRKRFLSEALGRGKVAKTLWTDIETTTNWTQIVKNLLGWNYFTNPKPPSLIKRFAELCTEKNDLIIDFFAGSGTTGHAVMALNAEEKAEAVKNDTNPDEVGNRRYICVQLPELTDEKSEAFKAGYKKISDITAERLRRAGKKIVEENKDLTLDTGFRLYRLTDSCYKVANVNYDSDNEQATLESFEKALKSGLSPLRDGVTEDDIITENLIKEGFPLNIALSKEKIGKTTFIHAETEGKRLFISFDKSIPLETIDEVQKGYKEAIFVVYDSALTDPLKVMFASRVTLRTI